MLVRSTLFSRLNYMSQQTMEVTTALTDVQKQIATGKRLTRMSQEPWSVAHVHQLRERIEVQDHYRTTSNLSQGILGQGDSSLAMVMNAVNRAREVSVQASNDVFGQDNLDSLSEEIINLKERVRSLANSDFNGRYIFSGNAYDVPPYDTSYAYQGTNDTVSIDVSKTSSVEVGFDGSDVFQGSTDVFAAFDDLIAGMQADDDGLIQAAMGDFDDVFNQLNRARTRIATEINIASDMEDLSISVSTHLQGRLSSIEDADMPEALTKFSMLQTQYQINLQLTSQMRSMSLFERM